VTAIAPRTRSAGIWSRSTAKASGTVLLPRPWITRAAISSQIEVASAASSDPRASRPRESAKTRRLPNASPIRPPIGVATEAESISTQDAVAWSAPKRCWISGSAGTVRACSSGCETTPKTRTA